jgi:hypothetical protein
MNTPKTPYGEHRIMRNGVVKVLVNGVGEVRFSA